jgi:hypothetical protein
MPNVSPTTGSSEPRIRAAIAQAAASTGVDFGYLYNQARIESSLDPQAKARSSSAAGLFQFTKQTWLQVVKAHGSDHGAAWASNAIERNGAGLNVADPQLRTAIDNLRYDPEFASAMAGEFAADNRSRLETGLGRSAEPVDLYLAHFLGSAGAVNFLAAHDADPDAEAAPLFPAAAAANKAIFYGPDGSPRSLNEIRASFAAKLDGVPLASGGTMMTETVPPVPYRIQTQRSVAESRARAPMEMASIEPIPQRLSLEFASRAYQRLAGLGA